MSIKIADAMNTYNPALNEILQLGYNITILDDEGDKYEWKAEKSDNIFIASDPLRLLAIIIIGEKHGESWNKQNLPDHYDDILEKHFN